MREKQLSARDNYIEKLWGSLIETHQFAVQKSQELGLERISLSGAEANLLGLLANLHGGKKWVEIGTLTGFSALGLLTDLPSGSELWTLEKNPEHLLKAGEVFDHYLDRHGPQETPVPGVEIRAWRKKSQEKSVYLVGGDARQTLSYLNSFAPFDGVFIDGNKAAYGDYLTWAEERVRPGGLIVADNVFLSGAVWGEVTTQKFSEKQVKVMQDFNLRLANNERYRSSLVPTLEGLLVAIKKF